MNNQLVAFSSANLPAALQQRLAQFNAGNVLSNLGGGEELDKISIKAGRFRIKQAGMDEVVLNQLHLDAVIVFANPHTSRAYYMKTYDPSAEDQSPDCSSSNGIGPDTGVRNPQSQTCQNCPQAIWGSKISPRGAKIKACGDSQRMAVLPLDPSTNNFFMVDGKPKAFGMSIPAASMKALGTYAKTLGQKGLPLEITLSRLTFDANAEFPKVEFAFNAVLPDQAAIYILDFVEQNSEHLKKLVGADIKVAQNVQIAVAPPTQPAPVQQVAPVVQPASVAPVAPLPSFGLGAPVAPTQPAVVAQPAPAIQPSPVMQPAPAIASAPNSLLNALQGVMG